MRLFQAMKAIFLILGEELRKPSSSKYSKELIKAPPLWSNWKETETHPYPHWQLNIQNWKIETWRAAFGNFEHLTFPRSFTNKGQSFSIFVSFLEANSFCISGMSIWRQQRSIMAIYVSYKYKHNKKICSVHPQNTYRGHHWLYNGRHLLLFFQKKRQAHFQGCCSTQAHLIGWVNHERNNQLGPAHGSSSHLRGGLLQQPDVHHKNHIYRVSQGWRTLQEGRTKKEKARETSTNLMMTLRDSWSMRIDWTSRVCMASRLLRISGAWNIENNIFCHKRWKNRGERT